MSPSRATACIVALAATACGRVGFDFDEPLDTTVSTGPALVQGTGNVAISSTTLSATFSTVPEAGHLLLLVGAGTIQSLLPTVGGAVSWTRATSSVTNPNVELWYGVADGVTSTVTIEAVSATAMSMFVSEWSGLDASAPLDSATKMDGMASPATAGALTTTGPALIIFAVSSFLPNTFGEPTDGPWTLADVRTNAADYFVWYRTSDAARVVEPTVTETRHAWDAVLGAFRISL